MGSSVPFIPMASPAATSAIQGSPNPPHCQSHLAVQWPVAEHGDMGTSGCQAIG